MPTGYTSPVVDGKITEFKDFALSCARAFGALIMMRDDPMNAPIPDEVKPSPYYADRLAESRDRLGELSAMTAAQAEVAAEAAFQAAVTQANKWNQEYDLEDARLDAMAEKVRAWTPPTSEHAQMKTFMLEQLSISKHSHRAPMPERLGGPAWLTGEIAKARRDVEYNATENMKELERSQGRTEWIKELKKSLQLEPSVY